MFGFLIGRQILHRIKYRILSVAKYAEDLITPLELVLIRLQFPKPCISLSAR